MTIANKLKTARTYLGKNQKEMAALVGTAYRSWQGYEQGTSFPGGKVIESLARLGFDLNWLLTDEGPMRRESSPSPAQPKAGEPKEPTISFEDLGMPEGMGLLAKIYSSGDMIFIRAINANLMAFGEALDNKVLAQNTARKLDEMNERMNEIEKQLAALRLENKDLKARIRDGTKKVANG